MEAEPSLWSQIFAFGGNVLSHWLVIVLSIGTPQVLDTLVTAVLKNNPELKRKFHSHFTYNRKVALIAFLTVCSFSYASFQTYQEQYLKVIEAKRGERDAFKLAAATPTGQQARISELEKDLGTAYAEIAKLRSETEERVLTDDIKKYLVSMLFDYRDKKPKIRVIYANTAEAEKFARQWERVFRDAGWNLVEENKEYMPGNMSLSAFEGLGVQIKKDEGKDFAVGAPVRLYRAIQCIGIQADKLSTSESWEGDDDLIVLGVGTKKKGDQLLIRDEKACDVARQTPKP